MKALAVRQPWAWALVAGIKPVENRDWSEEYPALHFARRYRGPVLILASKAMKRIDMAACQMLAFDNGHNVPSRSDLQFGGIIGVADLIDVVTSHSSPWFFGPLALVFENPRPLPFIPFKGVLGFFDVPDDLIARAA